MRIDFIYFFIKRYRYHIWYNTNEAIYRETDNIHELIIHNIPTTKHCYSYDGDHRDQNYFHQF